MSAQSTTIVQSNRSSNEIVCTVVLRERQPLVAARDRIDRVDDRGLAERAQQRREAAHRAGAVAVGAAVAREQDALGACAARRTRARAPRRPSGRWRRDLGAHGADARHGAVLRSGPRRPRLRRLGRRTTAAGVRFGLATGRPRALLVLAHDRGELLAHVDRDVVHEAQLRCALQLQLATDRPAQKARGLLQPGDHAVGGRVVADRPRRRRWRRRGRR